MRVTLNGIKRRGLVNWKARERWVDRLVHIWSDEHGAWWRPNGIGYTMKTAEAGIYPFPDAWDATKKLGPEKRIVFVTVLFATGGVVK